MSSAKVQDRELWLRAVGEAIRSRRLEQGLSQEALGYKAGLHRTYVSDVERGQRNPTLVTLRALALTLHVQASDVLRAAEVLLNDLEL